MPIAAATVKAEFKAEFKAVSIQTHRPNARVTKHFHFTMPLSPPFLTGFMGKRREARERAVQFLFQHDLNPPGDLGRALDEFWESQRAAAIAGEKGPATWGQPIELPPPSADEAEMRLFADPLIRGAIQHRDQADELIKKHVKNWEIHRIAAVDRNILRLAIFEMLHREDIPPVVSINEAVDIAKKFSTQDSGKFVNGILDKVKGELMRPARNVK
jgi:N utilization substance protein B